MAIIKKRGSDWNPLIFIYNLKITEPLRAQHQP